MTRNFIQRKFREYYSRATLTAPPRIERREFGVGTEKKIDSRHMHFKNQDELNFYLRSAVPLYISYSAAFYEYPDARPMPNKNWLGADLIFDLDADECDVHCTHPRDEICEDCMKVVKTETSRLVNHFLRKDFGFTEDDMIVVFSGNRGFHVHVRSESVSDLDQNARKEIVDYITAEKISLVHPGPGKQLLGPTPNSPGWGGRLAFVLYDSVKSSASAKELREKKGLSSSGFTTMFKNKEATLEGLTTGVWSKAGLSARAWDDLIRDTAGKLRVNLDKGVTMDMARLLRLPGSLHGGTGFAAREITDLSSFDPFADPIVFGEEPVKTKPKKEREFTLKGKKFKITPGEEIELPEYAAVYAACRDWVNVYD